MKADKQYPFVISSLTEEDNIEALNDIRLAIQPSMHADYKDSEFPIERLGLEEGNVTMAMRRLHDKIVSDSGEESPLGLIIDGLGHYNVLMRAVAPKPDFPEIASDKACEYLIDKLGSEECTSRRVSGLPWKQWFCLAVKLGEADRRKVLEKGHYRNESRLNRIVNRYTKITKEIVESILKEEAENNPYSSLALFGVERLDDLIKTSTLYPRDLKNLDSPPNSNVGLRENVELMKFLTQHLKQAKRREALLEATYCCASGCCLDPDFLLRIKTISLKGGLALDLLLTKEANIFWSPEKETELSEAMDEFLGTLDGLVANYEASKVRYPTLGKK